MAILELIQKRRTQHQKSLAVLIDPDKSDDPDKLSRLIQLANENFIQFFFLGGSLVMNADLSAIIQRIRKESKQPIVLFPGSPLQIVPGADAVLFLSLISGRNPDLLIGQHVQAAPLLRNLGMEIIPTGYLLINSGKLTSAAYVSNTFPIPEDKYALAASTAMAGEMLGLKLLYLDAGSGAEKEISPKMISTVRKSVDLPLIVGGGIDSELKAEAAFKAGADLIVVGNALEKDPDLIKLIAEKAFQPTQDQ